MVRGPEVFAVIMIVDKARRVQSYNAYLAISIIDTYTSKRIWTPLLYLRIGASAEAPFTKDWIIHNLDHHHDHKCCLSSGTAKVPLEDTE